MAQDQRKDVRIYIRATAALRDRMDKILPRWAISETAAFTAAMNSYLDYCEAWGHPPEINCVMVPRAAAATSGLIPAPASETKDWSVVSNLQPVVYGKKALDTAAKAAEK